MVIKAALCSFFYNGSQMISCNLMKFCLSKTVRVICILTVLQKNKNGNFLYHTDSCMLTLLLGLFMPRRLFTLSKYKTLMEPAFQRTTKTDRSLQIHEQPACLNPQSSHKRSLGTLSSILLFDRLKSRRQPEGGSRMALHGGVERSRFLCHKVGYLLNPFPFSATSYSFSRPVINFRQCNFLTSFLELTVFSFRYFAVSSSVSKSVGHQETLVLLPRPDPCLLFLRSSATAASTDILHSRSAIISFRSVSSHRHQMPGMADKHQDRLAEVIELIERDEADMETKLTQRNLDLSILVVTKILHLLNIRGISALPFFDWVRKTHSSFRPNSEIYNLIIDNLGRLEDYDSMLLLLDELSSKRHCLAEKAFDFLSTYGSDRPRAINAVKRVVEILNQVKGSCRSSGIYYLIKVLCDVNHFDFAFFVMEETARKTSYYNILIAAKCKSGSFDEAQELFDEMKSFGCDPNVKSYNYLLGSLCKKGRVVEGCDLLEKMEKLGFSPDPITFEIIAVHACRLGRLDFAIELLHHMISVGAKPRITTHAAFIKGFFYSRSPSMSEKDKWSVNSNYGLLVRLLCTTGRIVEAQEILVDMIEEGIKPHFPVYMRVLKELYKLGMGSKSADLKCRFLRFSSSRKEPSV